MSNQPRILIYGAGAIGSYMGAKLAESGADVTLLARGAHADAMAAAGGVMFLNPGGRDRLVPVKVCRPGETEGRYDIVFVALKTTQIASNADDLMRVIADGGAMVMVQNGLPWWYFEGVDSQWRGSSLRSLDPDGTLARKMDLRHVIGCAVYRPAQLSAPGTVMAPEISYERLIIGELDGKKSERCRLVATALNTATIPCEITCDIRAAAWQKLMVNLIWNPITALTQSAPGHISAYPPATELFKNILREGSAVAASLGVQVDLDGDTELKRMTGNFTGKPSMLQDVRAGRPMEVDSILNAAIEIADLTDVPVPTLRTMAACVGLLDERIRQDRVGFAPAPVA